MMKAIPLLPVLGLLLSACAGPSPRLVQGPLSAPPLPAPHYLERTPNGAIYQAHMPTASLFSSERRPQHIGDTLKVDIAESLQASQKNATDTSRDNKFAIKGPGSGSGDAKSGGFFESLLNANATAAGSDSFRGSGQTENSSSFNSQLAVTVINVLPNGHLLVAGERSMALNGSAQTLRFSGVVDPRDIKAGNIVQSRDVASANLESLGRGEVSEAASRSWIQRLLTRSLSIW
ncbi:flagellar basal body L-ring protein FlgH [Paucibacter sp. PLA-PC-4]|nr:flagellar basal body L-ring protein FlgH [Paucibacter sp. PLA-PC-4]